MVVQIKDRVRTVLVSFALFCFSAFLSSYSAQHPQVGTIGTSIIQECIYPIQQMGVYVRESIGGTWTGYVALRSAQERVTELSSEVKTLQDENVLLREALAENKRLRELLQMKQEYA